MQTSIRSTTDSTQHGDLPRTENDGGNSWKRLRSSLGLARDDDDRQYDQLSQQQLSFLLKLFHCYIQQYVLQYSGIMLS